MTRRPVAVLVVLALAGVLLTACRNNVGTAARVGDERISENRVNSFVTPTGATSEGLAAAAAAGSSLLAPKAIVLEFLIRESVFERALRKTGGVPSAGTLSALQDKALTALQFQGGANFESQLGAQLVGAGVSRSLIPHFVRWVEMVYYAGSTRLKTSTISETLARALKLAGPVTVSPRYGTWNAEQLAVSTDDANGAPSYLTIRPTAAASP